MDKSKKITITIETEKFYRSFIKNPFATASTEFVATIILILFLFILAIRPTIITINNIQTKINELTAFNSSLETKITSLETLMPLINNQKSKIELLNKAIPDQVDFPNFEKQLRYLVQDSNLELSNLSFSKLPIISETKDESSDNTVSYTISVNGQYQNIKTFLSKLQNLLRISTIDSVTIQKPNNNVKETNVNMIIVAKIYFGNI